MSWFKRSHALRWPAFIIAFLFSYGVAAAFTVPELTGPVVDPSGALSEATQQGLAHFLQQLRALGGAQIQVALVPTTGEVPIEQVSIQITDQWKLGKAKEDRGVLLLIATQDRHLRIEVGKGLEGDLPDVTASRIIREVITPRFKEGALDRGVIDGVLAIAHYTDPKLAEQIEDAPKASAPPPRHAGSRVFTILFWLFILIIFLRPPGRGGMAGLLLYGLSGGGGGGGGSSGGGGWSGGGGGFSGGGASGGW